MNELIQFCAIPVLMTVLSVIIPQVTLTRKLAAVMLWIHLGIVVHIFWPLFQGNITTMTFAPGLLTDRLGASFVVLTVFVVACCVMHADCFFAGEKQTLDTADVNHFKIFYASLHIFLLAMTFVFLCDNLGYLWIAIETTTLSSAPLVYFDRTKNALEATWKYLIICSVGIAFALLGTVFIFASSQQGLYGAGSMDISQLVAHAEGLNFSLLRIGFICCIIGYGTKAGIFPLHSWLPDAHSEAPAPASAMLSGGLLNCALFGIWRVSEIVLAAHPKSLTYEILAVLGTITVLAASLLLIRQNSFKRMWAYSSIENVGIMLVAIGIGSGGLFFLQAVNHSITKVALFLISGNIIQACGTKKLAQMHGIIQSSPIWGGLLALGAFAVTGAPPFGSFISEMAILLDGAATHTVLVVLLIIGIAISFVAISTHVGRVLVGTPKLDFQAFQPLRASAVPMVLIIGSLLLGLFIRVDFWQNLR